MDVKPAPLSGALILQPKRFGDARGFFSETFSRRRFEEVCPGVDFVQDNLSFSTQSPTLRGLHFQGPPHAQAKLLSVVRGEVLDVIVDLRSSSKTFGRHFAVTLSAAEGNQLFVPAGFAHGFITSESDTVFAYKVSAYYSPEHDTGIRFDDPRFGIDWGVDPDRIQLSEKDRNLPLFEPDRKYFP